MSEASALQPGRYSRAKYIAREIAVLVAPAVFGSAATVGAAFMAMRYAGHVLKDVSDPRLAISVGQGLEAPLQIIATYLTLRLARFVRDLAPFPGEDGGGAYTVVSLLCGLNILFWIACLPWWVFWR